MGKVIRKAILTLSLVMGLAACGGPPPIEMPEIAFSGGPIVRLEAEGPVDVVDLYRPPLTSPHIEHLYRLAPHQVARTWFKSRIALSGNGGDVRLTIHEASVRQDRVKTSGRLFGVLGKKEARQMTARLRVTMDFVGAGGRAASAEANVEAVRLLRRGATDQEAEIAYFELLDELGKQFDAEMTRQIKDAFRPVFRRAA